MGSAALSKYRFWVYNTLIGTEAGDKLTTGSGNVLIGNIDAAAVQYWQETIKNSWL